jgi:hypothetical protein
MISEETPRLSSWQFQSLLACLYRPQNNFFLLFFIFLSLFALYASKITYLRLLVYRRSMYTGTPSTTSWRVSVYGSVSNPVDLHRAKEPHSLAIACSSGNRTDIFQDSIGLGTATRL